MKARGGGDIRATGSGNIGAANVARNAGALAGVLTLLLDAGKGYLAVWLAARWTGGNVHWMMAAAVAAVVGHMFPVWLRFKGGKGVATGLGVFLPICWQAVAAAARAVDSGRGVLAILVARLDCCGCGDAGARVPVLLAAPRPCDLHQLEHDSDFAARAREASRQHGAPDRRQRKPAGRCAARYAAYSPPERFRCLAGPPPTATSHVAYAATLVR